MGFFLLRKIQIECGWMKVEGVRGLASILGMALMLWQCGSITSLPGKYYTNKLALFLVYIFPTRSCPKIISQISHRPSQFNLSLSLPQINHYHPIIMLDSIKIWVTHSRTPAKTHPQPQVFFSHLSPLGSISTSCVVSSSFILILVKNLFSQRYIHTGGPVHNMPSCKEV